MRTEIQSSKEGLEGYSQGPKLGAEDQQVRYKIAKPKAIANSKNIKAEPFFSLRRTLSNMN